ncbi:MAG: protein kinase domain-containing protein, partial [Peptostreptococcaceae bacterium]
MQISTNINLKILEKINSEGVNSALYIVEDTQLGCKFILKQIDKKNLKEYERYFDESKKICKLENPNIISIKHASYDDKYIYIVMPYFENGSLYNLLQRENLTIREVIKYSLDFLQAVYEIHNNNMVHCDIKPNNILISDENRAILTDFGSSLYLDEKGNAKLKNVYYKHIAPEQCLNSTINKKIDIYQIGT